MASCAGAGFHWGDGKGGLRSLVVDHLISTSRTTIVESSQVASIRMKDLLRGPRRRDLERKPERSLQ
jgi:hypothetical protein